MFLDVLVVCPFALFVLPSYLTILLPEIVVILTYST